MRLVAILAALTTATACTRFPPGPAPAASPEAMRPAQAFASTLGALRSAIQARVDAEPGEYGIAVIDVETGRFAGVNEDLVVHAASTMKVPILLEVYRRAGAGTLRLDDAVPVTNVFRSLADSSSYTLPRESDSEHGLHDLVGGMATYRDIARRMTVRSSNLAANILIERLGASAIQETTERVGGSGMRVLRGVEDIPAFRAGMNNVATARGLAHVLASIARCDVLPRAECGEVVDVLAAQEFNEMIPAGLPPGTRVAHKTGWITGIQHDGAIVLPEASPPFVVVVLSRGAADTLAPRRVAAEVARMAWDALGPGGSERPRWPAETAERLELHRAARASAFPAPTLGYDELWGTLGPIVDGSPLLEREVVGRAGSGRPLYLVRAGSGPVRVLFWSQMHGDETTASRALTDVLRYIASAPEDARVRRWGERLTVLALPMLNPDGADAHRRRSAHGIDVNRDARAQATPEGRTLATVRERYRPDFGFNLHDQNPRSRVGSTPRTAAIALLAPPPDARATQTPSFARAQRLAAHLAVAFSPMVGEHLTRYDDSYNARAFGDAMQTWDVSTVLIETGSWRDDPSKHYLRAANFLALTAALDAIADGSFERADPRTYATLPANGRALNDLLIRGGMVVVPGLEPYRADVSIDAAAVGGPSATQIVDVGDLAEVVARDTLDATGLYLHAAGMHPGRHPAFEIRRTAEPTSELVWSVDGVTLRRYALRAAR